MAINLLPDERIDDLERDGYSIIQNSKRFCFGIDAVLLSWFARVKEGETALDLGTGTGVIPILLAAKTKGRQFTGLEIQEEVADMAERSVKMNHLEDRVLIRQGDIKEASQMFDGASFDVVTSNPPYMMGGSGLTNSDSSKAISRHEILCTLEDVIREGSKVLKVGGHFYMVHRPFRLSDIVELMLTYKLAPKRMCLVHPTLEKEASLVLIEGIRGAKPQIKVEPPVIVFDPDGKESLQIRQIHGRA